MTTDREFHDILRKRAALLSHAEEEAIEETDLFVLLSINTEKYGICAKHIREIVRREKITYIPNAPDRIAGLINLRGEIISIIDLREDLNISGDKEVDSSTEKAIIIIQWESHSVGLLVDQVIGISELPTSHIEEPLLTLDKIKGEHIAGEIRIDDDIYGLLDVKNVLGIKDDE